MASPLLPGGTLFFRAARTQGAPVHQDRTGDAQSGLRDGKARDVAAE
jgi:hypothetical protein